MNHSDWLALGSASAIRGGVFARPVNPRLLSQLVTKGRPSKAAAQARQVRRAVYEAYKVAGEVDALLSAAPVRRSKPPTQSGVALWQLNLPGVAGRRAYERHVAVLQRWHGLR
jgi:hypothetical protein